MTVLFFAAGLLGAVALVLALWGARLAQFFSLRMPQRLQQELTPDCPPVVIILPVKGLEPGSRENIAALCRQDYPNYRIIFAVESAADPVVPLLKELTADAACRAQIVVAGIARDRGQKIHNQLAAVARTTADDQILAFMDADANPGPKWLHALVHPLTYGPWVGAATGYRFYIPASPHPANALLCVANAGIAVLFGPFRRTFAWGGSMAIRRADFFGYGVDAAWQNALSDDYCLTWCVKKQARKQIHFVPQCIVASDCHHTWNTLFAFATRQYRITRICSPGAYVAAVLGPLFYISALTLLPIAALVAAANGVWFWWIFALGEGVVYGATILRGLFLLRVGKRMLPGHWPAIARRWAWFTIYYPAVQAFNLASVIAAGAGRRITWRGITYTMVTRTETRIEHFWPNQSILTRRQPGPGL